MSEVNTTTVNEVANSGLLAKTFFQLTADECAAINSQFVPKINGVDVPLRWVTGSQAVDLIGIREVGPDEPRHLQFGKKNWFIQANKANRLPSLDKIKAYMRTFQSGKYVANGETMILGSDNLIINGGHRMTALALLHLVGNGANSAPMNLRIPVLMVENAPPEFADTVDTGRSRDTKQTFMRHVDIFEGDLGEASLGDVSFGGLIPDVRKKLCKDLDSCIKGLLLRSSGKKIHGSLPTAERTTDRAFEMKERVENLEALIERVYAHDKGVTGDLETFSKVWSRGQVACVIVLASNLEAKPSDASLTIDFELAEELLKALSDSSLESHFGKSKLSITQKSKQGSKPDRDAVFAMLIRGVQQYLVATEYQVKDKEGTVVGTVTPDYFVNVWKRVEWNAYPTESALTINKLDKNGKRKSNPEYPYLGGLDCGYKGKETGEVVEAETEE